MPEFGMNEAEFREALRRQILSFLRLIERRMGIELNVDVLVIPKESAIQTPDSRRSA